MNKLYILYDASCGFCVRCRWWMARQPAFVELEFIPSGSPLVGEQFEGLELSDAVSELVVVDSDGGVYRSADAWLMCLWALKEYREWSVRLAAPAVKPFSRQAFEVLSKRRHRLARWLGYTPEYDLAAAMVGRTPSCVTCGE